MFFSKSQHTSDGSVLDLVLKFFKKNTLLTVLSKLFFYFGHNIKNVQISKKRTQERQISFIKYIVAHGR